MAEESITATADGLGDGWETSGRGDRVIADKLVAFGWLETETQGGNRLTQIYPENGRYNGVWLFDIPRQSHGNETVGCFTGTQC